MRKTSALTLAAAGVLSLTACTNAETDSAPVPAPAATSTGNESTPEETNEPATEGSGAIDETLVEDSIAGTITEAVGVTPQTVTCPESVSISVGSTFQCSVDIDGQTLLMDVTQESEEGDLAYAEADGQIILSLTDIEEELTMLAQSDLASGQLEVPETTESVAGACVLPQGEEVYIGRVGDTLDCAIADEDMNNIYVIATIENEAGELTYRYAE